MTRKDFNIIAQILAQIAWSENGLGKGVYENRGYISDMLAQTNPNFNPTRFWQAVENGEKDLEKLFS